MAAATLIRLTLGLIFAVSAAAKISGPRAFVASVRRYEILPDFLAAPAAAVAVAAEAVVALALLTGLHTGIALVGAAALLLVFTIALASTLLRERAIECGCLGGFVQLRLDWASVATNLVLAALALAAATQATLGVPTPGERAAGATIFVLWSTAALLAGVYWLATYARSVFRFVEDELAKGADA